MWGMWCWYWMGGRGICCNACNIWYHINCQSMSSTMYSILNKSSGKKIVWECMKCGMSNFSTSLFDTTASLETHKIWFFIVTVRPWESDTRYNCPPHTAASSQIVHRSMEAKGKATKAALNHPLRHTVLSELWLCITLARSFLPWSLFFLISGFWLKTCFLFAWH